MDKVIKINNFFRVATKQDVEQVRGKVLLSERQEFVFENYYLKKKDVNFIADSLFVSAETVSKELRQIRDKIFPFIFQKTDKSKN